MDFNEILNNVIAGLICSATISFVVFVFNFLKNKYNQNKSLFLMRLQFSFALLGLVCNCFALAEDSNSLLPKWLLIVCFFINFFGMFLYLENALKYNK